MQGTKAGGAKGEPRVARLETQSFTGGPRRFDPQTSHNPSAERRGVISKPDVLTGAPRLLAGAQGDWTTVRVVIQRSAEPKPPGRVEAKTSVRLSAETTAQQSSELLLIDGPRLTGEPNGSISVGREATQIS